MRRFPFLLLLIAMVALTSWYVSAQESPGSEVESSMKGEDLDGDGNVDVRDEILRRYGPGLGPNHVGGKKRRPLDLPSGGKKKKDVEEDALEVILLFGNAIEGNVFVFLGVSQNAESESLITGAQVKAGVVGAIDQLTSRARFTVVLYGGMTWENGEENEPLVWSTKLQRATRSNRHSATRWINAIEPDESAFHTCKFMRSALTAIEIGNSSKASATVALVCIANWPPEPSSSAGMEAAVESYLEGIKAANTKRLRIHTAFVRPYGGEPEMHITAGRAFWGGLADQNRGTYSEVEPL